MRAPTTPRASKRQLGTASASQPPLVRKTSRLPEVVWKTPVEKSHCSVEGVLGFISDHLFAVAMVVSFALISWVVRNKGGLAVFEDFVMDLIACATGLAISHWHEFWAKRQQSSRRLRHELLEYVNISLNILIRPTDATARHKLIFRTLTEVRGKDLFDDHNFDLVTDAAQETTRENAILPLDKRYRRDILNFVLNAVSRLFAEGSLRRDLGQPVVGEVYLLCLVNERGDKVASQKLRVMIIKKSVLTDDAVMCMDHEELAYEQPKTHFERWVTLRQMAAAYKEDLMLEFKDRAFVEVELFVSDTTGGARA